MVALLVNNTPKRYNSYMNIITRVSPLVKECELRAPPIVIRVNKFDDDAA